MFEKNFTLTKGELTSGDKDVFALREQEFLEDLHRLGEFILASCKDQGWAAGCLSVRADIEYDFSSRSEGPDVMITFELIKD